MSRRENSPRMRRALREARCLGEHVLIASAQDTPHGAAIEIGFDGVRLTHISEVAVHLLRFVAKETSAYTDPVCTGCAQANRRLVAALALLTDDGGVSERLN